ncbi:unnamed protein product [Ectocarpus sp. 12 AP-2014]
MTAIDVRWTPSSAEEKNYYDRLFQLADTSGAQRLAGSSAVTFLQASGLPFPLLKQIWDISAGDPSLNYLRPEDFYVAMRLIAMAQASPGVPISAERLALERTSSLPLARMQNVPPPPTGSVSQGLAFSGGALVAHEPLVGADPYAMSGQERSKYESIFPTYDSDRDGFVTGTEAVDLFSKSRLPREQLRQIWQLADADGDSKLSLAEFCVGMHLIVCVSKRGLPCPMTRPPSLLPGSRTASGVVTSPAQAHGGSLATSVPPSPVVRPSPAMRPPSSPPAVMMPLGTAASKSDAFSALAVDLPTKDLMSTFGIEAEAKTPASEQGPPALEPPMTSTQHQPNAAVSRSPTGTHVSDNTSPEGESSPAGMQELSAASSTLLAVTRDASTAHSQATAAQSSSVHSMKKLVEILKAEKESLSSIVEAGRAAQTDNEQLLRDMGTELENLRHELDCLRNEYQKQQGETAELRARVAHTEVDRATLLAEIKACDSSIRTQKAENAFLRQHVLGENGTLEEKGSEPTTTDGEDKGSSLAGKMAEQLEVSPAPEEAKPTTGAPPEPMTPAKTPPPPPHGMVPQPTAVEDPFAEVVGEHGSRSAGPSSPNPLGDDPPELNTAVEREQGGFDAFPPVDDAFENGTDPFAVDGLSANGSGEAVADPFTATDAVFTNATAAADGFDAFPAADAQQFDAFGQ